MSDKTDHAKEAWYDIRGPICGRNCDECGRAHPEECERHIRTIRVYIDAAVAEKDEEIERL